jgi:hypothetical protein
MGVVAVRLIGKASPFALPGKPRGLVARPGRMALLVPEFRFIPALQPPFPPRQCPPGRAGCTR